VPSNIVLKKVRASIWLTCLVIGWGITMTCMGAVKNFHGLVACRVILGIFEARNLQSNSTEAQLITRIGRLLSRRCLHRLDLVSSTRTSTTTRDILHGLGVLGCSERLTGLWHRPPRWGSGHSGMAVHFPHRRSDYRGSRYGHAILDC
jgi:hypothetical protein